MADDLLPRFDELVTNVVAPLVLGGRVDPVRPFGPRLGLAIGEGRKISDPDLRSRLDVARVRVARLLAPVDTVPDLTPEDFALAAVFNDLLQSSNLDLSGPLTRGRHVRLVGSALALAKAIPRPRNIGEALARHTVLARALEVVRTDTTVSWWTGSSSFRGQPAPGRLLAWRELRRVREETRRVPLVEMTSDVPTLTAEAWLEAIGAWLSRSPVTDLATAGRRAPAFRWTDASLALIATVPGRSLAFRALARQRPGDAASALERANAALAEAPDAQALAAAFLKEVTQGFAAFGKKV
jgi:hypothetical protein